MWDRDISKRKEMHNVKYSPKIDIYFVHRHQILLNDNFLQKTSPCFHYDYSRFLCMRVGLVSAPVISSSYMRREYANHFGNLVFILFYYILIHGRMLKEVHPCIEIYVMSLGREIIAYQFVEHEVGRTVISNFSSMNEHGKGDAPCRDSFRSITYMAFQGSQRSFPWHEDFARVSKE